jgi:PAS domain S-box-containing protein
VANLFKNLLIKRKVTAVTVLTSFVVLLVTIAAFTAFDSYSYRRMVVDCYSTKAAILAAHSNSAVVTRDQAEAETLLAALQADQNLLRAALYNQKGELFARYPKSEPPTAFPKTPAPPEWRFEKGHLICLVPVREGPVVTGTLFLETEVRPLYTRLRSYTGIALLVLAGSLLLALGLSQVLQRGITRPILALAQTAKTVSHRQDFSLRAPRFGNDELGSLTDAFNQMLARIQQTEGELRDSRARFSGMIESAMDAIISIDAAQRISLFNRAAEKMFACSAAEAKGQPLDRFIPPRYRERHRNDVEEFGRTGVTTRAMAHLRPLTALRSNGEEFPIEASISQVEIGGEKIYTVILRDITARQRAQEQVRQMNLELEQRVEKRTAELTAANRELEAFTYSVAHDLRAPLRHIDAFSKILRDEFAANLPSEARSLLEKVGTGSRYMSRLVDDLLNLARVGRQPLQREPIPLNRLADEVIGDLKGELEDRVIEWRVSPLPTIGCDPGLMKQVFANLLSNAAKYTRPRPKAVIEVGMLDGGATVFVRDNGVGFDMKYADKLFGVFQRLHPLDQFEGTGIGLATVERIIRKHGGCVWAEGAPNKGAVFYFSLPPESSFTTTQAPS